MLLPPTVNVAFDRKNLRGDQNAPITIVEFADYQCPYCKQAEATVAQVLKKYAGRVNVAFRDFPLTSIHPYAEKASEAARCAAQEGKFWEFHDALFASQSQAGRIQPLRDRSDHGVECTIVPVLPRVGGIAAACVARSGRWKEGRYFLHARLLP